MGQGSGPQRQGFAEFGSAAEYNRAHPEAVMPASADARNRLRSFTCAGAGCEDDLVTGEGDVHPGLPARRRSRPGRAGAAWERRSLPLGQPALSRARTRVSLRTAWTAIVERWPSTLSAAADAAQSLSPGL